MEPKELFEFLVEYFRQNPKEVPAVFIWGPQEIDKSAIVKQAVREVYQISADISEEYYVKHIILSPLIDEYDFCSIAALMLPQEGRDAERGVVFFDGLVSAPPEVQYIVCQIILNRSAVGYTLPDGWFAIAAGNRRATVYELRVPLANRFIHFELEGTEEVLGK